VECLVPPCSLSAAFENSRPVPKDGVIGLIQLVGGSRWHLSGVIGPKLTCSFGEP